MKSRWAVLMCLPLHHPTSHSFRRSVPAALGGRILTAETDSDSWWSHMAHGNVAGANDILALSAAESLLMLIE
jgi:hypothetical protein